MKRYGAIAVLLLVILTGVALAADPPGRLSQAATPTPVYRVFSPVAGSQPSADGAGSALSRWWLGVGALVVLGLVYLALQIKKNAPK